MKNKKKKEKGFLKELKEDDFVGMAKVAALYVGMLGGVKLLQDFANRDVK